jgi:hypothetical protein
MARAGYLPEERRPQATGAAYAGALRRRTILTDGIVGAFMEDWRQHGTKALERLRETNVATYCKLMVLLVPRDLRVEHHVDPTKELSNEQLDSMIAHITERLEAKASEARIINAQAIEALPKPLENPDDCEAELHPPRSKFKPYRVAKRRPKKRKLKPRIAD